MRFANLPDIDLHPEENEDKDEEEMKENKISNVEHSM